MRCFLEGLEGPASPRFHGFSTAYPRREGLGSVSTRRGNGECATECASSLFTWATGVPYWGKREWRRFVANVAQSTTACAPTACKSSKSRNTQSSLSAQLVERRFARVRGGFLLRRTGA